MARLIRPGVAFSFLTLPALAGCESSETKVCLAAYASAQDVVRGIDAKSRESVDTSLASVEQALAACRQAQRHGEVDQLIPVRNQLVAQRGALERRAARGAAKPRTPEELRQLEQKGDPSCPRGQAYRPEGGKEIRCTGPQLAEMRATEVAAYFDELGYRVKRPAPERLEVERGAEHATFVYPSAATDARPKCVVLLPAPGIPWAEALARATGINPSRAKTSGKLKLMQGELPYEVDERDTRIRLGACGSL